MFLIDSNVWLERLLGQERAGEVAEFLEAIPDEKLFITDFAFHSISIALLNLDKEPLLEEFVNDLFIEGSVRLIRLEPRDLGLIIAAKQHFKLDFDDAYQYVASKKYDLTLVSFDSDFDRTDLKRKTPGQIIKQ